MKVLGLRITLFLSRLGWTLFSYLLLVCFGLVVFASCGTASSKSQSILATGVLDSSFASHTGSGFVGSVDAIALQSDGKILLGGRLTTFDGTTVHNILRLDTTGSLDNTFVVGNGFNDSVTALALQSDGSIIVVGQFASYDGIVAKGMARVSSSGSLDLDFAALMGTGFTGTVGAVAVNSSNEIYVGGAFTQFNGQSRGGLVKFSATGVEDTGFAANIGTGFDLGINSIVVRPDDSVCVAGSFTTFQSSTAHRLACFDEQGNLLSEFMSLNNGGFNNSVSRMIGAGSSDRGLYLGGLFTQVSGVSHSYFTYIEPDGQFLNSNAYNQVEALDGEVQSFAIDNDGNLMIGGVFSHLGTTEVGGLIRLSGASLDQSFSTNVGIGFDASVLAIAVQSDGKIIVGGEFTSFKGRTGLGGIARIE